MTFQQTPYTELLLFSAVVSGSLAVYAFHRYLNTTRNQRAVLYFGALMTFAMAWSLSSALGVAEVERGAKLFWYQITNVTTVFVPLAWFAFALAYTDNESFLTRPVWGALAVEPAIVVAATVTAGSHDLYYHHVEIVTTPGFRVLTREFGPLFVLHAAYSYALVVVGALLFLKFVRLNEHEYRSQAVLLVGGSLLPVVSNAVFLFEVTSGYVNLTPIALGVAGLAFAVAITRYRFFDLAPIARDSVVQGMRDGYLVCDEDGRVVDSNPAARRLLDEVEDADLVGTAVRTLLPEVADELAPADFDGGIDRDESKHELVWGGEDDETDRRFVDVTVTPLAVADGTLVVLRDITERRRTERKFQTLIERSSDVITIVDADGTIDYMSPSIKGVLGVPPAAVVGQSVFDLVHADDEPMMRKAFQEGLGSSGFIDKVEYRVLDADGEWRVHEAVGRNLLDDPDVEGIVVNARDVTERRQRERELEATNERLERFASVVSHDLRNPLNVADGYAELLSDRVDDPAVGEIRTSHERMRRIIEDVLALARNEDVVDDREPVALATIATDAWEAVDTGNATLEVADGTVFANRSRLARVFENFFRNSVEHGSKSNWTQSGDSVEHAGEDVTVEVGPAGDGDGFYVADDGPGIPDDIAGSLFEEGVSGEGGTGLGLAIVAEIVDAHGWVVDVDPTADGARFEVRPADHAVLADPA